MNTFLFENEEEKKYALACLAFSKSLNLIDDDSLEGVKKRCDAENEKRKAQLENGETVYGLTHFSYPAFLNFELTRLKLDFVGESEKVRRKPAPDSVAEAMSLLGSTKEETLYVGDSEVDIATAKNAGIDCLSVSWGFRTGEQLIASGATDIIDRPSQIAAFLGL